MNDKNNYYVFNDLELSHAFFVKPYNFNATLVDSDSLKKQYEEVKELLKLDNIATVTQAHTDIIKIVTEENINEVDTADGMLTNLKGVGIATKVADCQAIFLYDPVKQVIGNIHSGWKGTVQKIVGKAIKMMVDNFNCDTNDIKVFISPSIGKDHFEVDEDVYLMFKNAFEEFDIDKYTDYKKDINKYYIDTEMLNHDYLISLGIKEDKISISHICTVCHGDNIHSYRYDKDNSGRNLAIISL